MDKSLKLVALALAVAVVARADGDKPPSTEDAMVVHLAPAQWKAAPKPLPEGVFVSPIAVNPETKGSIAYAKFKPGLEFPTHWHSHNEYTVQIAGKGTFTIEGKAHEMSPGDYIVIPAKAKHSVTCAADNECIVLTRRAGPTDYNWVK